MEGAYLYLITSLGEAQNTLIECALVEACRACYEVGKTYNTPFISGKDSLYNESPLGPVAPTLLITALGIIPSCFNAVTMDLKKAGSKLYIIGETKKELGGSEYYHLQGSLGSSVPQLDALKAVQSYKKITDAIHSKLILSCHDISEGGLAVALAEMAFTGGLGLKINLNKVPVTEKLRFDFLLFSESNRAVHGVGDIGRNDLMNNSINNCL